MTTSLLQHSEHFISCLQLPVLFLPEHFWKERLNNLEGIGLNFCLSISVMPRGKKKKNQRKKKKDNKRGREWKNMRFLNRSVPLWTFQFAKALESTEDFRQLNNKAFLFQVMHNLISPHKMVISDLWVGRKSFSEYGTLLICHSPTLIL